MVRFVNTKTGAYFDVKKNSIMFSVFDKNEDYEEEIIKDDENLKGKGKKTSKQKK